MGQSMKNAHLLRILGLFLVATVALRADTEAPVPVRTVAPDYPGALKRSGVSGLVTLSCLIDEKGDGKMTRTETFDFGLRPPMWVIYSW